MNRMIESPIPEIACSKAPEAQSRPTSGPREQLVSWLIVGESLILAYLVFRLVMLELDMHSLLDQLLALTGQAPLSKS